MSTERRRLLVRTAAAEFAAAGYERASLNRIIQACGLSKSSFYHVIASKRALFDLVVRDLTAELSAAFTFPEPEQFSGQFWGTTTRLFQQLMIVAQTDDYLQILGRMFYLSLPTDGADSGETTAVTEALASVERWVHRVLLVGRESGAVREDLPAGLQSRLVFAVLRVLDEWSVANLQRIPPEDVPGLMTAQLATIRRMLERDNAPG